MARIPSINLLLHQFEAVASDMLSKEQIEEIFRRAAKFRPSRILIKTPKTNVAKVEAVLRPGNPILFAQLLYEQRIKAGHQCMLMTEHDPAWKTLVNIASDAEEYCTVFNIGQQDGYLEYVKEGLIAVGKPFIFNKLRYHKGTVFQKKERKVIISSDPKPASTRALYEEFIKFFKLRHTEIYWQAQHANFVLLASVIRDNGLHWRKFIEFAAETYVGKIPEPSWLLQEEFVAKFSAIKS